MSRHDFVEVFKDFLTIYLGFKNYLFIYLLTSSIDLQEVKFQFKCQFVKLFLCDSI